MGLTYLNILCICFCFLLLIFIVFLAFINISTTAIIHWVQNMTWPNLGTIITPTSKCKGEIADHYRIAVAALHLYMFEVCATLTFVLISQRGHIKVWQNEGLKQPLSQSLEVKTQGIGRPVLPLKTYGEKLSCFFQLLVALGIHWFVPTSLYSRLP